MSEIDEAAAPVATCPECGIVHDPTAGCCTEIRGAERLPIPRGLRVTAPTTLAKSIEVQPTSTRPLSKDRPSVMEILQAARPTMESKTEIVKRVDEIGPKIENASLAGELHVKGPSPFDLEFKVVSPDLASMIENASNSSSPPNPVQTVVSSPTSPLTEGHDDAADLFDNKSSGLSEGREIPVFDNDAIEKSANIPRSPQKARRGRVSGYGRGGPSKRIQPADADADTLTDTDSLPSLNSVEITNQITGYFPALGDVNSKLDQTPSRPQTASPASQRGRKRGRGRGRGRGKCWSNIKRHKVGSLTPQTWENKINIDLDDKVPHYECDGPADNSGLLATPTSISSENIGLTDVEKRIEQIQSLVSNIQKESQIATEARATRDRKALDNSKTSPARGNLKLKIKLGWNKMKHRGQKRFRYAEDVEYQPVLTKRQKLEGELPKRSSSRRHERDQFLDKYRYLALCSDDSRSPSPLLDTIVGSGHVMNEVKCRPCKVHLFDFVKCFNIKNLSDLKNLDYNKLIRRRIRALEKGTQVEMLKAVKRIRKAVSKKSTKGSPVRKEVSRAPPVIGVEDEVDASDQTTLATHLDNIFDDVLSGPKKKKGKTRKRSTTEAEIENVPEEPTRTIEYASVLASEHNLPSTPTSVAAVANKKFRCRKCNFATVELLAIQEHILLHEEPFTCSECPATFSQMIRASEHTITGHPNTDTAKVIRVPNFNPNDHFDEIFQSPETETEDSAPGEERETSYQCKLCSFRTDDRQEIENHLQNSHRSEYQYVCKICDLAFCRKKETMLKHFKKVHPDQPLDFTTAPGVEEKDSSEMSPFKSSSTDSAKSSDPANDDVVISRPASVISIASECSADPPTDNEIQGQNPPEKEDVQVIEVTEGDNDTPSVLCAENRPCTYKCLDCGAKTDTFDVICAHLEVSHPDKDYSFSCPFCGEYKAKTCSFVAEHIRTAHCEHSGRCMERRLQNAKRYVCRDYTDPTVVHEAPRNVASPGADPVRTPTQETNAPNPETKTPNQENKSPDDEVLILDFATEQSRLPPLQPLSLVHHTQEQQQLQQAPSPPVEMVRIFSDFSVTKAEYERYQVFNLKPPRKTAPPAANTTAPRPVMHRAPFTNGQQPAPSRPPPLIRPMPSLQPRPFVPATFLPPMTLQRPTAVPALAQPSLSSLPNVNHNIPSSLLNMNNMPHLMHLMHLPSSMAQPMLYNGIGNQPP